MDTPSAAEILWSFNLWAANLPILMLIVGAMEMFLGGILAALFRFFFCVKLHDRGLSVWLFVAISMLGARLIGARVFDMPLDWFAGLIYLSMGTSILVIGINKARVSSVFSRHGVRCPKKPSDPSPFSVSSARD